MIFIRFFCIFTCLVIFLLTMLRGIRGRKAEKCQTFFLIVPRVFDDTYNKVSLQKSHKKAIRISFFLRKNPLFLNLMYRLLKKYTVSLKLI